MTRIYKFVCKSCNRKVKRETYVTICPLYCNKCKNKRHKGLVAAKTR